MSAPPLPRDIALQFEKFPFTPAANGFRFRATLENNAFLFAKLDVPAAGQHYSAVHGFEFEFPGQLAAQNRGVVDVRVRLRFRRARR